ncbi:hypothetical protein ACA910_013000 [Epithemia clementina (nom. ined.)]
MSRGRFSWRAVGLYVYMIMLHMVCFSIYAIPMFVWKSPLDQGLPVLDELHIVSLEHKDIYYTPQQQQQQEQQQQQQQPHDKDKDNDDDYYSNPTCRAASTTTTTSTTGQPLFRVAAWWCWWQQQVLNSSIGKDPVWTNDYWGRPMSSYSSHKSWRPLSILSFRYLRFPKLYNHPFMMIMMMNDLDNHRLVNALLHTFTGELVALLALLLFTPNQQQQQSSSSSSRPPAARKNRGGATTNKSSSSSIFFGMLLSTSSYSFWLYTLTKLLFAFHPTHVEVTANAANRPHLIATAAMCLLSNPQLPYVLFVVVMILGFLSAETFLFGVVPAAVTMTILAYQQQQQQGYSPKSTTTLWRQTLTAVKAVFLRIATLLIGSLVYYLGRQSMDWLSIPTGLIRPAENPYFRLTGRERFVNYAYVTALHMAKSWDLDWVGFSHEYGYKCLEPIESFSDVRLLIPLAVIVVLIGLPLLWFFGMGRCCVCVVVGNGNAGTEATPIATATALSLPPPQPPTALPLPQEEGALSSPTFAPRDQQPCENQEFLPKPFPTTMATTTTTNLTPEPPQQQQKVRVWSPSFLLWLFHLSWLVTLFPIMGIVKVGTFVADRIVVTSSVSVCILVAHVLASWFTTTEETAPAGIVTNKKSSKSSRKRRKQQQQSALLSSSSSSWLVWLLLSPSCSDSGSSCPPTTPTNWRLLLVVAMLAAGWRRIHMRTWEWMDAYPLLTSSLKTCPRSAKSHLEISKIYSGLYPARYNLPLARWHLQQVEDIDPTYCDVHFQYVHIALQEQEFLEMEERLTKSMPCRYTMGQAMAMWTKYWEIAMGPIGATNRAMLESAKERQLKYRDQYLQEAAAMEEQEKEEDRANSHLVNWRGT